MKLEIRDLNKRDYRKAIEFAVKGMHFDRYINKEPALSAYGRYFLYLELQRATHVFAAYMGTRLVGVLIADLRNEEKKYRSLWRSLYVGLVKLGMKCMAAGGADLYDAANQKMYEQYTQQAEPDGEICFLAADNTVRGQGIGTRLLQALTEKARGKRVYLYTDSNCTYQFYEHRGFQKIGEEPIRMEIQGKSIPLSCYLYEKILG